MIFKTLKLTNYGPFPGEQSINLQPISKDKPIILIGGMNGAGKTSILDAIQLLFFGKRANCTGRKPLSYSNYLKECIHKGAVNEKASIELVFERWTGGEKEKIEITREWFQNKLEIKESLFVKRNGENDRFLSSSWNDVVEGYLPFGVSHLFFFNGEKIKELADTTESASIIRTAIHSLLGADIIDKLIADLHTLERKKSISLLSANQKSIIEKFRKAILDLEEQKSQYELDKEKQQKCVNSLHKQLKRINRVFVNEGGEIFEKRKALETEYINMKEKFQNIENEMRMASAGALPLLFAVELIEQSVSQAEKELDIQLQKNVITLLDKRDKFLIDSLQENTNLDKQQLNNVKTYLAEDVAKRSSIANANTYIELSGSDTQKILYQHMEIIPKQHTSTLDLLGQYEILEKQITNLEREISAVPEEDKIAKILDKREVIKIALNKAETMLLNTNKTLIEMDNKISIAQLSLATQIKKLVQFDFDNEDSQRIVASSISSREILNTFRKHLIKKNLSKIEKLAFESSTELFRKSNLITKISIHEENYSLSLEDSDNNPLYNAKLSEGERQLLAVSLLWGLAKASEYPLPAIIDTPLGRLDSSHRIRLVEKYFPKASHQVILLSTDEEVTNKFYKKMEPWISRTYHLEHQKGSNQTLIKDGYFPWFRRK